MIFEMVDAREPLQNPETDMRATCFLDLKSDDCTFRLCDYISSA